MSNNYQYIKKSYRDPLVADTYDARRFRSSTVPRRQMLNRLFLRALTGIINTIRTEGYPDIFLLDIPCGTGRIFPTLLSKGISLIGADISMEMMRAWTPARLIGRVSHQKLKSDSAVPLIQCDAERMPFKDKSFDAVSCLRFLTMKVPQEARGVIFREMTRVSRAWIILECQHKNQFSDILNWIAQKIFRRPPVYNYFSRDGIKQELSDAGIKVERIFYPFGLFSNKWLLLGRIL